jgi:hypothetical protein
MHTSSRFLAIVAASALVVGCGGGNDSDASASATSAPADTPVTTASTADESVATDSTATTVPSEGSIPEEVLGEDDLTPICETVPPLDVISAIVGTPVATVTDYSDPVIEIEGTVTRNDRCEVVGDDIGLAIFERYDIESADAVLALVEGQGGTVVAIDDPRLSGAVGWGNGVMIESDGVYWYATAITPTTIGQFDAPEAYAASGDLLAAWLGV